MSRKGTRVDYIEEMKRDVVAAFKSVVRAYDGPYPIPVGELYNRVITSPQKRYYVSPMQCYKVLCRVRKGDMSEVNRMPPHRREMYRQLYEITQRMAGRTLTKGESFYMLCCHAVGHPAPRLFVGYHTVQNIINEYYKTRLCEKR